MINDFDTITFKNNKLYILGYSYDYNATYDKKNNIERILILEKQDDYTQEYIELGSTNGPYTITAKDNKSKTYAWYEKEINLDGLEKGLYSLQVYTKTSDAEDYGEIRDSFGMLETQQIKQNNKTYTLRINKERENRVELIVE